MCFNTHPQLNGVHAEESMWVVGYDWFFIRHVKWTDGVSKIFSPTSISGRMSNNSLGTSNRGGISVIISSYPTPKIMLMLIQPHYEHELHKNRHTWTDQMWMMQNSHFYIYYRPMKHSDKKRYISSRRSNCDLSYLDDWKHRFHQPPQVYSL